MRMLLYAYAYVVIRVCPAFVIHCHTFALCGIVLHNKRNGKVKARIMTIDRTIIERVQNLALTSYSNTRCRISKLARFGNSTINISYSMVLHIIRADILRVT